MLDNLDPYYDLGVKAKNREAVEAAAHASGASLRIVPQDLTNRDAMDALFAAQRPAFVFHEAAQAGVRPSLVDPFRYLHVNTEGTLNLLEAARRNGVKRFVNASSSSVYGKAAYTPFDEAHPTQPVSPYGVSKLAAEHLARIYHEAHGMPTVSLRYFTVYGPRMRPNMAISNFTARAFEGKPPVIFGDGTARRDFTHIDDVVELNLRLLDTGAADGKILNVGAGGVITVKDLAEEVLRLVGAKVAPLYRERQPGDADVTHADASLARKLIGVAPKVAIRDGLARFVAWYRENPWYATYAREAARDSERGA